MEDAVTVSTAVKTAFAAVNVLVWSGLFLYVLALGRRLRGLEAQTAQPTTKRDDPQ